MNTKNFVLFLYVSVLQATFGRELGQRLDTGSSSAVEPQCCYVTRTVPLPWLMKNIRITISSVLASKYHTYVRRQNGYLEYMRGYSIEAHWAPSSNAAFVNAHLSTVILLITLSLLSDDVIVLSLQQAYMYQNNSNAPSEAVTLQSTVSLQLASGALG